MKNLDNIKKEAIQAIERGIDKQFENWVQYWKDETDGFLIDIDDLTCYLWNDDPQYRELIEAAMRDRIENLFVGIFHYGNMDFEVFLGNFFGSDEFIQRERKMINEFVDLDKKARELQDEYYTERHNEKMFRREVNSTYL